MKSRGLLIDHHVDLLLKSRLDLQDLGLFTRTNPHTLGVTSWAPRSSQSITIGILRGLPADLFRMVLAHEYAHAYLTCLGRRAEVPTVIEEGFAQALALDYLTTELDTPSVWFLAHDVRSDSDPIYGDGVRLMEPVIRRYGIRTTARLLVTGEWSRLGLG